MSPPPQGDSAACEASVVPSSNGPVTHNETQTADFLRQARNQAGLIEAFRNHSGSGRFDFVTQDYFDDTFTVDGFNYSAGQFGNHLAGYSGAYHGSFLGYLGARAGGVFYDVFEERFHTDFDRESIPYIRDGSARGQLDRDRGIRARPGCKNK